MHPDAPYELFSSCGDEAVLLPRGCDILQSAEDVVNEGVIKINKLPPICVALGCKDSSQLRRLALGACDRGERFLELRLDLLDDPASGAGVIRRILRRYPDTILLATCRRRQNGGGLRANIERQIEILDAAVAAGAALVDIEIETAEGAPQSLDRFRGRVRLIISYHDFDRTPALNRAIRRLEKVPADIYKLATMARKPSDNARMLALPTAHPEKPMVLLVMGELGVPSRVLGLARKSIFVFAAPDSDGAGKRGSPVQPTAPGQLPATVLRNLYRAHKCKASTEVYGVIADPVSHSMSPVIHNKAFQVRRLDAVYLPFLVRPAMLADFFRAVEKLPLAGLSVTLPHKQRVIRHLHAVDALAKQIGAVNTVFRRRGKLCGTNTDAQGITRPLEKRVRLDKASVLVVGNGGAARAAVFALRDKGSRVTLTGRNPVRVRALARASGVEALDRAQLDRRGYDVLIHATPLGMHPHVGDCFFPQRIPAELVFDLVYNPLETELIRRARAARKQTISGLEMFVEQACAQFEVWTPDKAPRTAMRNAVLKQLGARA